MAANTPEQNPFLKQLVSSDKKYRDQAVDSIRLYLTSGRSFSQLELLKLWRGLFFCMWHSDRPPTQQRLCATLASLVSILPQDLFLPFVSAFWTTITKNYSSIDSLRMDKFLLLIRRYINSAFTYLQTKNWDGELLSDYKDVIAGVLLEEQGKVSDGLRYHIMDCWIEELNRLDQMEEAPTEDIMDVVTNVAEKGRTKVLRLHAKGILKDEKLQEWRAGRSATGNFDQAQ